MEKDDFITSVVFRKWKDGGSIIALMPYDSEDPNERTVNSYEHIGQHGSAYYEGVISQTVPATKEEFDSLWRELEDIGYNVHIIQKPNRAKMEKARKEREQHLKSL